jgi:pimeloyl-ACP methyl ester carboxylesterase
MNHDRASWDNGQNPASVALESAPELPPLPPGEAVRIRIHNPDSTPTLVYLPGLHGDWTLIGGFRHELGRRARFVEVTYPRTLSWSLDDYAAGIEQALADHGVTGGWLLAESFGSQVLWQLLRRGNFGAEAAILAGGFVRHPLKWGVLAAESICGRLSLGLLTRLLFGYARIARFRYRKNPELTAALTEFIERRTDLDRQAAKHRLHLIAHNDPRPLAAAVKLPIYALTGLLDPVVPWVPVRSWLRKSCPTLCEYRVITCADHNVLGTGSRAAANLVCGWIHGGRSSSSSATFAFQRA